MTAAAAVAAVAEAAEAEVAVELVEDSIDGWERQWVERLTLHKRMWEGLDSGLGEPGPGGRRRRRRRRTEFAAAHFDLATI